MRILIAILFVFLFSCSQNYPTKSTAKDYLSVWFWDNERALHEAFLNHVRMDSINHPEDNDWHSRTYEFYDSSDLLGQFTLQAKKYNDCVHLQYVYNKKETPHAQVLLSANYSRSCLPATDSLLNAIQEAKHFKVTRYEPATEGDIFRFDNGDIVYKDLRVQTEGQIPPYKLTIYVPGADKKVLEEAQEDLPKYLFGEEVYLKKISTVTYKTEATDNPLLMTIDDFKAQLQAQEKRTTTSFAKAGLR